MTLTNWMLLPLAIAAMACSRAEDRATADRAFADEEQVAAAPVDEPQRSEPLTPTDQGNSEADLSTSQRIRAAVVADDSLSMDAKNVKIITVDGKVTLRGPVETDREREAIVELAESIAGAGQVDDQLAVTAEELPNSEMEDE